MMEFSSPLAAMHPPSCHAWGRQRDLPSSGLMYSGAPTLAPSTFNFTGMSTTRSKSANDYFSPRPQRGSSPTASLAADLSTNFHIDQSPQFPTPRRSLFLKDTFLPFRDQGLLITPPVDCQGATTPPVPSSSPGIDLMDISPLPHKAPCFVAHVILPSPSPEETPTQDDEMLSSPAIQRQQATLPLRPPPTMVHSFSGPLPERRRPSLQRPALMRTKNYSTTSVPRKSSKETLLPPFQFGSGPSGPSCSSTPLPSRPFSESQFEDMRITSMTTDALSAPRRPSLSHLTRGNGSPVANAYVKKPTVTAARPRKQVRRSLSMFQHPDDVMKERDTYEHPVPVSTLQSVKDIDSPYQPKLPHFKPDEPDSLPRIQQDTLINVLNGDYSSHYSKVTVVDCRFEYEYKGGHIEGAVNYNDKDLLASDLFADAAASNTLLILHCEYSVHRAPRMAKAIRNRDRAVNAHQYPKLSYPEMYILDGGYSKFFEQYRTKCFPQNYVEMEHKDHEQACERGMGKLKQRQKLSRAQTFAFGQQSCQMEDSPTGMARAASRSYSNFEYGADFSSPMARHTVRRLVT